MNHGQPRRVAFRLVVLCCVQLALASCKLFAQNVTIHVRVLDGRTGHDLSGMNPAFVDYHSESSNGGVDDLNGRLPIKTTPDGARYTAEPHASAVLVFNGMGIGGAWTPCTRQGFYDSEKRTYGSDYLYRVDVIAASGLVSTNTCGKTKAVAKPGELVIFIRPTTWWERFVAGMKS